MSDFDWSQLDTSIPSLNYDTSNALYVDPYASDHIEVTGQYQPDPYPSDGGGSGLDSLLKFLPAAVSAYGQIQNINHGAYSSYGTGATSSAAQAAESSSGGAIAPAAPAASGFDWSKLSDFSSPYPYAIGLTGLLLLTMMMQRH